jgi:hypothetical protein
LYVVNIRLNERASGLAASNNQFKGRPPAEKEDGHTHKEREKERERERNGKRESERERERHFAAEWPKKMVLQSWE